MRASTPCAASAPASTCATSGRASRGGDQDEDDRPTCGAERRRCRSAQARRGPRRGPRGRVDSGRVDDGAAGERGERPARPGSSTRRTTSGLLGSSVEQPAHACDVAARALRRPRRVGVVGAPRRAALVAGRRRRRRSAQRDPRGLGGRHAVEREPPHDEQPLDVDRPSTGGARRRSARTGRARTGGPRCAASRGRRRGGGRPRRRSARASAPCRRFVVARASPWRDSARPTRFGPLWRVSPPTRRPAATSAIAPSHECVTRS